LSADHDTGRANVSRGADETFGRAPRGHGRETVPQRHETVPQLGLVDAIVSRGLTTDSRPPTSDLRPPTSKFVSDLLLIAIFGGHLLAVDVAAAGPLLAIWLEWRATRRGDVFAGEIGRRLAIWSLAAAVIGVGLGLLTALALPQLEPPEYRQALSRVTPYLWWSVAGELAFYVACIAGYILLWKRWQSHRFWHRALAVLASTNVLYHFPTLFTIVSALSMRPQLADLPLDAPLFRKMLVQGEVVSRVVHHWLASLAVAAVFAMWLAAKKSQSPDPGGSGDRSAAAIVKQAARMALSATTAQVAVGIWVLLTLPAAMENQMLGEDWLATALFGGSIVAALGLMHHLSVIALGDVSRRLVGRAALLIALVVLLMSATLHRARQRALEPVKVSDLAPSARAASYHL
jgi:hypothetical protein